MKPYIKFSIIFSIVIIVAILLNIQSFHSIVRIEDDQPYKLEERCSGNGVLYASYDKDYLMSSYNYLKIRSILN